MTTVTVYNSTDGSAPTLTGQAGSLLGVLDACLVNGYGAQSAAGWTKPYANSANIGCYKNSAVDGTGYCLSVNDAGPGAGSYREARLTGFATMTSVSAGTQQFPGYSAMPIGSGAVVCRKSATADSTQRVWTLIADDTVFYLFVETGDSTSPLWPYPIMFGDIFSYKANDAFRCMLIGRNGENTNTSLCDGFSAISGGGAGMYTNSMPGHFMASSWVGVVSGVACGKHFDSSKMGQLSNQSVTGTGQLSNSTPVAIGVAPGSTNSFPFPNAVDGALFLSPIWVTHNGSVRGYMKGAWAPLHDRPLNHNDTYSGTGAMSGKTFLSKSIVAAVNSSSTAYAGQVHMETSSTWS